MKKKSSHIGTLLISLLLSLPTGASAGGFAILEQSAEGIGVAYAGAAAGYGDGSEIAFNPAAMAWLDGTLISHSTHFIIPKADFTDQGSSNLISGAPLSGGGSDGGETAYVPSFYVAHQLNDRAHVGFGIHSPFGLATEYDDGWVGRYEAIKSELLTVSLTPAFSYEVVENFSIGAGVNVLYADAELTNAIDFGTIGVGTLGPAAAAALGLSPQANDGLASVEGDDWAVGFTLGAAYRYCNDSRIGLAWKSRISVDVEGDADFQVPTAALPLTATGLFVDQGASAGVDLPESINLGWIHNINETWGLLAELQWTRWSRFQELRVQFDGAQPDNVTYEGWNNVWRYSVGVRYTPVEDIDLTAGFTFDEEPIADAETRTPRIPGNDRRWMAFGVKYRATDALTLKATYAHLFVSDPGTNITDDLGNNLVGEFDANVNLVGLGIDYNLG